MQPFIEVKSLRKYFKTPAGMLHAVDDVSFTIDKSQTMGVVGESGCGKSTLGRVMINLLDATAGSVIFDGREVIGAPKSAQKELRRDMQIIFQDPFSSLDPRMTVREIIAEPLRRFHDYKDKGDLNDKVSRLMDTAGLTSRLCNSYPHELDGGRRQRIGIARALALNPKFIVCDEPVSALDVSIQAQILNLMQDLQEEKGLTYLFITHDLSVVKHISDNILVMYLGEVVERASSRSLFARQFHPYTRALLSAIPLAKTGARKKRQLIRGEITSPIDPEPGCRFAARCPFAIDVCRSATPNMEQAEPGHYVACHRYKEL